MCTAWTCLLKLQYPKLPTLYSSFRKLCVHSMPMFAPPAHEAGAALVMTRGACACSAACTSSGRCRRSTCTARSCATSCSSGHRRRRCSSRCAWPACCTSSSLTRARCCACLNPAGDSGTCSAVKRNCPTRIRLLSRALFMCMHTFVRVRMHRVFWHLCAGRGHLHGAADAHQRHHDEALLQGARHALSTYVAA